MITMQLTPTDIQDAKKVIDKAVDGGDLEAGKLYRSLFIGMTQVGAVFDVGLAAEPVTQRLRVRVTQLKLDDAEPRRLPTRRRKKAIKP